jgi:hypothetical protein
MIFTENLNEIDSSESYYKVLLCNKDVLVVAFINIGISNHELNTEENLKFIEKCYIICYSIDFLKVNNTVLYDNKNDSQTYYFGGFNLSADNITDIEIKTNKLILKVCNDSKIQNNHFIPIDTPSFKTNMDTTEVNLFFDTQLRIL